VKPNIGQATEQRPGGPQTRSQTSQPGDVEMGGHADIGGGTVDERKYRLASELRDKIDIAEIGERIMSTTIPKKVDEVLGLAPDLST
jgi:hypothetical protein